MQKIIITCAIFVLMVLIFTNILINPVDEVEYKGSQTELTNYKENLINKYKNSITEQEIDKLVEEYKESNSVKYKKIYEGDIKFSLRKSIFITSICFGGAFILKENIKRKFEK